MPDILSMMNAKVGIRRCVTTQDASGASVRTYQIVSANVPCVFIQFSGQQAVRYGADRNIYGGTARFLPTADVRPQDDLVLGTRKLSVKAVNAVYGRDGSLWSVVADWEEEKPENVNTNPAVAIADGSGEGV